jgi:tetratricopeptide (TPR) repeat protein
MISGKYLSWLMLCALLVCMLPVVQAAEEEKIDDAIKLYNNASGYLNTGEYETALSLLNQALALNTTLFVTSGARQYALLDKSKIQIELKDYDGALETIDAALLAEESDKLWYNKGYLLLQTGEYDQAVSAFDRAIKLTPDYSVALINRGNALMKLGKNQDAIDSFSAGLAADAQSNDLTIGFKAKTMKNIGDAYYALGKYQEAISSYQSSLVNDPGNADTTAALERAKQQEQTGTILSIIVLIVIVLIAACAGYYFWQKKTSGIGSKQEEKGEKRKNR